MRVDSEAAADQQTEDQFSGLRAESTPRELESTRERKMDKQISENLRPSRLQNAESSPVVGESTPGLVRVDSRSGQRFNSNLEQQASRLQHSMSRLQQQPSRLQIERVDSDPNGQIVRRCRLYTTALFLSLTARFLFPRHPKLYNQGES